jgi:hypothetical protein
MVLLVVWIASSYLGGAMVVNVNHLLDLNGLGDIFALTLCSLAFVTLCLLYICE